MFIMVGLSNAWWRENGTDGNEKNVTVAAAAARIRKRRAGIWWANGVSRQT